MDVQVEMELDGFAFEGASGFLFGSVPKVFLGRHGSLNPFNPTAPRTSRRVAADAARADCTRHMAATDA